MQAEYTPGPWIVVESKRTLIVAESGHRVATCEDLSTANARLIAAAPELLAAIKQIARLSETADRHRLDVASMLGDIARAALVKVES